MTDNSEKYFINWINSKLRCRKIQIEDVGRDFNDGLKLIALMEELTD